MLLSMLLSISPMGNGYLILKDKAAKSHFVMVQTSCLHKIWLQAGRLHHNIWIITVLFSLFAASS